MLQARLGDGDYQLLGSSRLRAHVTFSQKSTGPKFLTLADLVTIMHEESRDYRLLSVRLIKNNLLLLGASSHTLAGKLLLLHLSNTGASYGSIWWEVSLWCTRT